MSKKMWNKIFKNKPLKNSASTVKSTSNENNRYSYYEEFYSTCTVPPSKVSVNPASGKSKFSLVVNSFSLKRNSKETNIKKNKNVNLNIKQNNDDDFNTPMDLTPTSFTDAIDSLTTIHTKPLTEPNLKIPDEAEKFELHPCRICSRTFVQKTLLKHVVICEKMAIKKRKQFDSLRQRTEGTELADYVPKKFGLPITKSFPERSVSPKPKVSVTVVKTESETILLKKPEILASPEVEQIAETIESKVCTPTTSAVKVPLNNRQKATTPLRESIRKRNLVPESNQCPHCLRFFGVKAYERHYIWCKEKSLDIATKNLGVTQAAKERLEARINYRAPNLKTKRAVNREKYSGFNDEDDFLKNSKVMCSSLGSSFMSDGTETFVRTGLTDRELEDIFEREFTANNCNLDSILDTSKTEKISIDKHLKIIEVEDGNGISDTISRCSIKSKSSGDTYFSGIEVDLNTSFCLSTDDDQRSRGRLIYFDCPNDSISSSNSTFSEKSYSIRGLSDKYDPFQSAKRQLEELCSPPSPDQQQKFVHSPITKTFPRSKMSPGKLSTSYNSMNPSPLTNPKVALSAIKSNFRRTSSLRSPRKAAFLASRPIYQPPNNVRPTIQRGLSDEGPISSNFLKTEEYDEMPVRSVCSNDFAITNSPRVIRRDSSTSNRRNLGLNLSKENSHNTMPSTQISKTDSLAIFLKYENEAKTIESPVTTKDLKDKSNTLSKQNSAKNIVSDIQEKSQIEENVVTIAKSTPLSQSQRYDTCMSINKVHPIRLDPLPNKFLANHLTPKHSPKLKQNADMLILSTLSSNVNLNSIFDTKQISDDFIDPKLINDIDNLPINVTKLSSDSDLTSNISSENGINQKIAIFDTQSQYNDSQPSQIQDYQHEQQQTPTQNETKTQTQFQQQQIEPIQLKPLPDSNRNSTDSRNLLKRKMRVGRNQFLYDASPESEIDNGSINSFDDEQLQQNSTLNAFGMNVKKQTSPTNIPPFDEFDFEEFLTSFENDSEQFPIFKDCREFLIGRSHNKQSSSSNKNNKINIDSVCSATSNNNNNNNNNSNIINNNNNNNNKISNNNNNNVENDNHNNNYTNMLFDRSSSKNVSESKLSNNDDEDKRHEIFISIETDQNDNDSIISSQENSLSGKPIALVEEIDANDNKFTKIIDDGITGDYNKNSQKITNKFPDVKRNNAKNLLLHDCQSPHEKNVIHESTENILGRHLQIESQLPNVVKKRPSTSATPEMIRYQQSFVKYSPSHKQQTLGGHSISSSSSENSLPPINSATNMDILMKSLTVSSFKDSKRSERSSNASTPTNSTKTLTTNLTNKIRKIKPTVSMPSGNNSNSRLSKFCHECGSKFLIETAKFCMDCGVKRMIV